MDNPKLPLQEVLKQVASGELTVAEAYSAIITEITKRISNAYMEGYDDGRTGLDDLFSEDE